MFLGHDEVIRREPTRLSLVCLDCNRQSPGWDLRRSLRLQRNGTSPHVGAALPLTPQSERLAA